MHDPMTVAFEIKRPWPEPRRHGPLSRFRYWPALVTVWHIDPELGGSDDSCGWSFPRLTKGDYAWAEANGERFWKERFGYGGIGMEPACTLEIVWSVWCEVRRFTAGAEGYIWKPLPRREQNEIIQLCVSSVDNLHFAVHQARQSAEGMRDLLVLIIRIQRRLFRPWYRHPRWHIHHWRFQIHPLQNLRRLFARCHVCGGHFGWGETACSGGGKAIWHMRCDQHPPAKLPAGSAIN